MSNTKHTPGPWKVTTLTINKPEDRGGSLVVTGFSSDKSDCPTAPIVCTMQLSTLNGKFNFIQNEAAANAKLIAASPEMLEVLESVAAYDNDRLRNELDTWEDYDRQLKNLAAKALAAIKKATP